MTIATAAAFAAAVAVAVADNKDIAVSMPRIFATGRHAKIDSIGFVLRMMLLVVVPVWLPAPLRLCLLLPCKFVMHRMFVTMSNLNLP